MLLFFSGLRRLLSRSQFSQKFLNHRSYTTSSPIVNEDRVALLNDDGGDHSYPKIVEKVFGIRETARLSLDFGVLWVNQILSCEFDHLLTLPAVFCRDGLDLMSMLVPAILMGSLGKLLHYS